jgi:hypothetical protein
MARSRKRQVWERAKGRCEYCGIHQESTVLSHEIDHIRAQKHSGKTTLNNLAFACFQCNSFKGPNIAGFDPVTDTIQPLFHPRRENWDDHFEWSGAELVGKTPVGRATIEVLRINLPVRIEHRQRLMELGLFDSRETDM